MLSAYLFVERHHPFTIDPVRALPAAFVLTALGASRVIGRRTGRARLEVGATAFLQMTLFTLLGVVLAYAFAANGAALWDVRFAAADKMLGFHWPFLLSLLDQFPILVWLLGVAYHSLTVQMIAIIVGLSGTARFATLRVMVCAAILSGFVTILISGFMPAMGNLFDPAKYGRLWPSIAWLEQGLITGLRDGTLRTLDLTMLMGIVSFPSFHATLSAIFIWALKDVPRVGRLGGLWAALTIIATPVFGGHYAVDVLMGLILAPPAIMIARWLTQRKRPPVLSERPVVV